MDCSPLGSSVHGILQIRIVEVLPFPFPGDLPNAGIKPISSSSAAAAAKSLQLCPTLCDPIDSSPLGSSVPGILQARILEWVAIFFSKAWKWKVKVKLLSCFWLLATPWSAAYQPPASMEFSRKEYWSGVPLPSPECMTRPSQLECFIFLPTMTGFRKAM